MCAVGRKATKRFYTQKGLQLRKIVGKNVPSSAFLKSEPNSESELAAQQSPIRTAEDPKLLPCLGLQGQVYLEES